MAIVQISERIIRENYPTLDEYLNQKLEHGESNLFYKDGLVYKIINKMNRLYRQSFLWILDQNKFDNCLNIESILYQGDKFLGSTTLFQENLENLKKIIESKKVDLYTATKILEILLNVQKELLKYNLCYTDPKLSNIGIKQGNILITDLDGVDYKPDKKLIHWSYINFYKTYLCLLLNENLYQYEKNEYLKIFGKDTKIEMLPEILSDVTETKKDIIKEKYYTYKKEENEKWKI